MNLLFDDQVRKKTLKGEKEGELCNGDNTIVILLPYICFSQFMWLLALPLTKRDTGHKADISRFTLIALLEFLGLQLIALLNSNDAVSHSVSESENQTGGLDEVYSRRRSL